MKKRLITVIIVPFLAIDTLAADFAMAEEIPKPPQSAYSIIDQLQTRLRSTQNFYHRLEEKILKTKGKITSLNEEILTLDGQLNLLKEQIALTEKKILDITMQITSSEQTIRNLLEEISIKETELDNQRKAIGNYLELMYYHKNQFFEGPGFHDLNALKLILQKDYTSSSLKEETYLKMLEDTGSDIFGKLEIIKTGMEQKKNQVEIERARMIYLNSQLVEERKILEIQKQGKEKLIEQTKGQKEVFQEMLMQSLDQQEEAKVEIEALRRNIDYFNSKISSQAQNLSPEEYEEIAKIREEFNEGSNSEKERYIFPIWPIAPRSISAYFEDPSYEKVFKVKHKAIDLPIIQGSPFLAPEKGLVVKTKDNGFGYNYIVIAHRHNLMTVYGHASVILVREGDFVDVGQILGFTGGTPGTPGAGTRTTGAHLHFEVYDKGMPVDPLDYLNLEVLPIEYIPVDKLKKYDNQSLDPLKEEIEKIIESQETGDEEVLKNLEGQ